MTDKTLTSPTDSPLPARSRAYSRQILPARCPSRRESSAGRGATCPSGDPRAPGNRTCRPVEYPASVPASGFRVRWNYKVSLCLESKDLQAVLRMSRIYDSMKKYLHTTKACSWLLMKWCQSQTLVEDYRLNPNCRPAPHVKWVIECKVLIWRVRSPKGPSKWKIVMSGTALIT